LEVREVLIQLASRSLGLGLGLGLGLEVREVLIQLACRSLGIVPPMTIAPTSSLKHIEKTLGAPG